MDDNAISNITQILASFDNFISILECSTWIRSASAEDIKNGFKLGLFIEKTIIHFKTKNILPEFFGVLSQWWNTKKRTKVYDEHFFQFACDQLLVQFFKYEDVLETSLEIAIRVYTSIFPKSRLKKVISNILLISSSQEAVTDFAKANMTDTDMKDLEYSLVLTSWSALLQSGKESDIVKEIDSKLSLYKIESALYLLIGILSLNSVTDSEKHVQNIVLENLLQKMLDRSLLSKSFWLTMFKKVELVYICRTCDNFDKFLDSVFNFAVYIGSMMKYENGAWQTIETVSMCPEISYRDLLQFIGSIYNTSDSLKNYVNQKLISAEEYTDSSIWQKIKQELC